MDVNSIYFSQRLDKNQSKKLSSKKKLGSSKSSKTNCSNESKRRSSTFFKEFFQVNSVTNISESEILKENVYNKLAFPSSLEEYSESSHKCSGSHDESSAAFKENSLGDPDLNLDDTLILKKSVPKKQLKESLNIYHDETISKSVKNDKEKEESLTVENNAGTDMLGRLSELKRCPLCLKKFEKLMSHIKTCASKYNVTTPQLFKAIDLQLKQNEERSALGLLSQVQKPSKPSRKPASSSKAQKDVNLELALALSLSLQESKESNLIQETDALIKIGLEGEALEKRKSLENFRVFEPIATTSKSTQGAKKWLRSTLFSRSQEERERIITEKVAIILMENDTCPTFDEPKESSKPKSLSRYLNESRNLWQLSKTEVKEINEFYVNKFSNIVIPPSEDISTRLKAKSPALQFDLPVESNLPLEEIFKPTVAVSTTSPSKKSGPENKNSTISTRACDLKQEKDNLLMKSLSSDWRSLLYQTTFSNVVIISREEKEIAAHKIVLFVRCPGIMTDLISETDSKTNVSKSLLIWNEYSQESIRLFLEYLYCAQVNFSKLEDEETKSDLFNLAERYDASELVKYIQTVRSMPKSSSLTSQSQTRESHLNCYSPSKSESITKSMPKSSSLTSQSKTRESHLNCYSPSKSESITKSMPKSSSLTSQSKTRESHLNCYSPSKSESITKSTSFSTEKCSFVNKSKNGIDDCLEIIQNPNFSNLQQSENFSEEKVESIRSLSPDMFLENENINTSQNEAYLDHRANLKCLIEAMRESDGDDGTNDGRENNDSCSEDNPVILSSSLEVVSEECKELSAQTSLRKNFSGPSSDCKAAEDIQPVEFFAESDEYNPSLTFSQKRKSSVDQDHDINKKLCLDDQNNIHSIDLTQDSNTNSTELNLALDDDADTLSLPEIGAKSVELKDDRTENLAIFNENSSTCSLPDHSSKSEKVLEKKISVSDSDSNSLLPPEIPERTKENSINCDKLNDREDSNYGYISAFWEDFDEGCAVFTSVPTVPEEERNVGVNSSLSQDSSSKQRLSSKHSSPENIVLSSDTNSINSPKRNLNQEIVFLSPEEVSSQKSEKLDNLSPPETIKSLPTNEMEVEIPSTHYNFQSRLSCEEVDGSLSQNDVHNSKNASAVSDSASESTIKASRSRSVNFTNDSLFENESFLNKIENEGATQGISRIEEIVRTPSPQLPNENISPLLDYSGMKTAEIKKELNKYGLKRTLGKKKAKVLLRHIYDELHPVSESVSCSEPISKNPENPAGTVLICDSDSEQEIDGNSKENDLDVSFSSETSTIPEESFKEEPLESLNPKSKSKFLTKDELEKLVIQFIKKDKCLHKKILMYEPIWLEKFYEDLKNESIKCKLNDLMDILDEKCITFRTLSSQKRNEKMKKKSRGRSSLSQQVKPTKRSKAVKEVNRDSD